MKVFVTGATGFIGYDLTRRLVGEGHQVTCSVRKTSNIDRLKKLKVDLVEADITDGRGISEAIGTASPDVLYHCAARVWDSDEKKLFQDNVQGTYEVCAACGRTNVKRLVHLSSVSVVSGNGQVPLTDKMEYKCSDAYGRSKAESEKIAVSYRKKGNNAAIIRPCMVYGEEEPHALGNIISSIMDRKIPVLNVPDMPGKLALAYISNVTDVLMLALDRPEALQGTFMVADKEVITIKKFIEIIADEIGAKKPFVIPSGVVRAAMLLPFARKKIKRIFKDRVYDISRIKDILNYTPRVSTEEGLRRTARHWKVSRRREQASAYSLLNGPLPGEEK